MAFYHDPSLIENHLVEMALKDPRLIPARDMCQLMMVKLSDKDELGQNEVTKEFLNGCACLLAFILAGYNTKDMPKVMGVFTHILAKHTLIFKTLMDDDPNAVQNNFHNPLDKP